MSEELQLLIKSMIEPDPNKRITFEQLFSHPLFQISFDSSQMQDFFQTIQ